MLTSAAVAGIAAALALASTASVAGAGESLVRPYVSPVARTLVAPIEVAGGIPVEVAGGIPVLEVMVNGRGPLRVGLDTGAMGGLYLFGGRAARLGLAPVGALSASDPSGVNPQQLSTYGRRQVTIGGRSFAAEIVGVDAPGPGRLSGLDGVIGLEAFGPALVTVDFPRQRLRVSAPGLPPPDGQTVFSYAGELPTLPLEVDGHPIEAYLDTGNVRAGIVIPAALADQLGGRRDARPSGAAHTLTTDTPMFALRLDGPARIGATALSGLEAEFPSVAPIAIVGAAALQGLVIRIDTLNRRIGLATGGAG